MRSAAFVWLPAAAAYAGLAIAAAWFLPVHLIYRSIGRVSGDTGVCVWNLWSFHHQVSKGGPPSLSIALLPSTRRHDLSPHYNKPLPDASAMLLVLFVDIVTLFTLIYLLAAVLTAPSTFALVQRFVSDA
jgi:hypothetical protein